MSTAVSKKLSTTQRRDEAARQAGELLGLDDLKAVAAALAEAALESVRRNPAFGDQVRMLHEQMTAPTRPKRAPSRRAAPDVALVPRKHVSGREANPGAAPDPYFLLELYEADQLPLALSRYKLPDLKLAAELVEQRNPGTKPSKRTRDGIIEYIVQHVTAQA